MLQLSHRAYFLALALCLCVTAHSQTTNPATKGTRTIVERDAEKEVLETIHLRVWSGFYSLNDLYEVIDDELEQEEGISKTKMRTAAKAELEKKYNAEKSWPKVTDNDRLTGVFAALDKRGIVCLHNAGYDMSDGHSDVDEAVAQNPKKNYWGYCFYHGQDVERAVQGMGVMLAFGDLKDNKVESLKAGNIIKEELERAGFKTAWNGTIDRRIDIPKFDWKKRSGR
jgi:hypothetical protein